MFATRLYRKPLKFEIEETGAKLEFVDKELILGWDDVHISRKDPNKKYIIGTAPVPPKIRYPPYLGAAFVRKRKLKSWMTGTWFAETTADDPERQRLGALRVLAELQIQGFPNKLLKSVVASIQSPRVRALRQTAQRYMAMAKKAWGSGINDPEKIREYMYELHHTTEVRWMVVEERAQATKPWGE